MEEYIIRTIQVVPLSCYYCCTIFQISANGIRKPCGRNREYRAGRWRIFPRGLELETIAVAADLCSRDSPGPVDESCERADLVWPSPEPNEAGQVLEERMGAQHGITCVRSGHGREAYSRAKQQADRSDTGAAQGATSSRLQGSTAERRVEAFGVHRHGARSCLERKTGGSDRVRPEHPQRRRAGHGANGGLDCPHQVHDLLRIHLP